MQRFNAGSYHSWHVMLLLSKLGGARAITLTMGHLLLESKLLEQNEL
jgi:hypothetical protein